MSDLYKTLGVDDDATPEQLKAAYRARAKELHPDAGGDADEFAELSRAYRVLSDPGSRLLYDQTGEPTRSPLEEEVPEQIMLAFFNLRSDDDTAPLIEACRQYFRDGIRNNRAQIEVFRRRAAVVEKQKARIQVTGDGGQGLGVGQNLFHSFADKLLGECAGGISGCEHNIAIAEACLEHLADYTETYSRRRGKDCKAQHLETHG